MIQPVGVLALGMTVLLTAKATGVRPSLPVVVAATASTTGVGAFVVLAAGSSVDTPVTPSAVAVAALLGTGAVAVLAALGAAGGPRLRCLAFATCGGVSYGLVSVLMRALSQQVRAVGLDPALLLPALGIAGALLVGGWFIQYAYASGPPEVVVACLTVVDPLVAVAVGVGLLGEAANTGPVTAGLQVCCALLAATGVVALARHQVHQPPAGPDPHGPGGPGAPRHPGPAVDSPTGRELDLVTTHSAPSHSAPSYSASSYSALSYDGRNL